MSVTLHDRAVKALSARIIEGDFKLLAVLIDMALEGKPFPVPASLPFVEEAAS